MYLAYFLKTKMFDFTQNFVHVCLYIIVLDGLIIDHSEIKTSNNPVQKITASLYFVCLLWTIHGISTIGHRKEACLWVAAVVTYAEMMWKPIQRWAWRQQGCQRSQCLTSPAKIAVEAFVEFKVITVSDQNGKEKDRKALMNKENFCCGIQLL